MKRLGPASLQILVLLVGLPVGSHILTQAQVDRAAGSPSGLWRKAVEVYRANEDWYPERAAIVSEVRSGRKKLVSLTEMDFSLRPGAQGRLEVRLDRARRNGVDTTEKTRAKARKSDPLKRVVLGDGTADSVSISDSPFDPEHQGSVSVAPREERRTLSGLSCRRFDFTFRAGLAEDGGAGQVTWRGRAWLEEGSGRPVRLEFSIAPLPRKFRRVEITYDYETERPDRWILRSVTISGQGGFLFIKRLFTVTTTFSEFRRNAAATRSP